MNEERVIDIDTGEVVTPLRESTAKYPNAHTVFLVFYPNGKYPANWRINVTQRKAAENLFKERGLPKIKAALGFYKENLEDKYCPKVRTPYELDSKWKALVDYKDL